MLHIQRNAGELVITHRVAMPARVEREGADEQARTVPLTIASDTPVATPTGVREILSHAPGAVDLSRAALGLPLQVAHRHGELPVGRVEQLTIEGGRLRGVARFSQTQRGQDAWRDVVDGIITDVSVGAIVRADDWTQEDEGVLRATRWQPVEVSLVSMGADPAAGVNREGDTMSEQGGGAAPQDNTASVQRGEAIAALFSGLDGEKWLRMERDAHRGGKSVEVVRAEVLAALKAEAGADLERHAPDAHITGGADAMEKWCDAAEQAVHARLGLAEGEPRDIERGLRDNDLAGLTLRELARDYLRARGERVSGLSAERLVDKAMRIPALVRATFSHSTSDFTNILGSSAEKALATGYQEAPETYQVWTRNVSMSNFRQHTFTNLSLFSDLAEVKEDAEYTHGTLSDRANTATLKTYGRLFGISRQAIVNDDLQAMSDIPRMMGRAAARQVGDLVYAVITGDVKLSEQAGATLFNTTDGNLASSAAALSVTSLDVAYTAMKTMTDPSGATLNIQPSFLLVPAAKETTARVLVASEKDPAEGTTTSFDAPNPFRNRFQVVAEPRLDADSTTAWYLLASPGAQVDTVVVGWLNGRQEPVLDQMEGFSVDGVQYKVRIDCTAAALDWRGMFANAGA